VRAPPIALFSMRVVFTPGEVVPLFGLGWGRLAHAFCLRSVVRPALLIRRSHSISLTRAQGVPKYKTGLGGERMGEFAHCYPCTTSFAPCTTPVLVQPCATIMVCTQCVTSFLHCPLSQDPGWCEPRPVLTKADRLPDGGAAVHSTVGRGCDTLRCMRGMRTLPLPHSLSTAATH
jgi:hypothetical protein